MSNYSKHTAFSAEGRVQSASAIARVKRLREKLDGLSRDLSELLGSEIRDYAWNDEELLKRAVEDVCVSSGKLAAWVAISESSAPLP